MSSIPTHPTVPLTTEENDRVAALITASPGFPVSGTVGLNNTPVFQQISLQEPDKDEVLAFHLATPLPPTIPPTLVPLPFSRRARAVVFEPTTNLTHYFLVAIDYPTLQIADMTVVLLSHVTEQVFPALSPYALELSTQWPSFDKGTFVGESITEFLLRDLEPVSQQVRAALLTRGIPAAMLADGTVRAEYLGDVEGFRESNGCNGCCGELISEGAPVKRYSTAFFRFYGSSPVVLDGRVLQTSIINAPGSTDAVMGASGPGPSYYDRQANLEGLLLKINVTDRRVEELIDFAFETTPNFNFDRIYRPRHAWNGDIQPLNIIMPQGPSHRYDAASGRVIFDNWTLYLSWDERAGIQLYNASYADTQAVDAAGYPMEVGVRVERGVLYKVSVADTLTSYNVGSPFVYRNFTSLESAGSVLRRLLPLQKGVHVPANATLIDIPLASRVSGQPDNTIQEKAVAIFERDGDLLTMFSGETVAIRGRELVIRSIFQGRLGNHIFDYVFAQDGTIKCQVQNTGRVAVALRAGQPDSIWGEYINKNYLGLLHTQMYCYRFDFNIDGRNNSVEMEETIPADNVKWCEKRPECCQNGPTKGKKKSHHHKSAIPSKIKCEDVINPCGHAGYAIHTPLKTEQQSLANINPATNRRWVILNSQSRNRCGEARGYSLIPQQNGASVAQDFSWLSRHLEFTKYNFFVTAYHVDEQYASGANPTLQDFDTGLMAWMQQDRCIHDTDVVVWYNLCLSHGCHPEDSPYTSTTMQSVVLAPHFFFEMNPACTLNQRINGTEAIDLTGVNNYNAVP